MLSRILEAVAASIIGVSLADGQGYGGRSPAEIRKILRDTGTPQVSDPRNIGPMPNLALAIPRILDRKPVASSCPALTCTADASASSDDHGISYQWGLGRRLEFDRRPDRHSHVRRGGLVSRTLTVADVQGQTSTTSQSVDVTITPPAEPGNFTATATSTTTVALSWTASTGGTGSKTYVIQRRNSFNAPWWPEYIITSTSSVDTQVWAGVRFEYRIKAVDDLGQSSEWIHDFALTVLFSPDVQQYVTIIDGDHLRDLRDAVDAWRSYAGLPQV